jgi:hypothetical protein
MVKKLMKEKKGLTIGKRISETYDPTIVEHNRKGLGTKIAIKIPGENKGAF